MFAQEPVQATIWQCLNHYDYVNAIFLAERLYAEVKSDEALFLVATCYYRNGYPNKAHALLTENPCPSTYCRLLLARCCLELNKLSECETAMTGSPFPKGRTCEEISAEFGDSAPYVMEILGTLYRRTERRSKSVEAYKHSLKLNPFLWSCFQSLCDMGEKPDPESIFQLPPSSTLSSTSRQTDNFPVIDTENLSSNNLQINVNESTPTSQIVDAVQDPSSICQLSGIRPFSNKLTPEFYDVNVTPENNTVSFFPPPAPVTSKLSVSRTRLRLGRNIFGGSNSGSPHSPSFGFLPLETPSPTDGGTTTYITPSPIETQLPEPKAPKRSVMRRNPSTKAPKPPVFSQMGNNSSNTKDNIPTALQSTPSPTPNIPAQVLFPSAQGVRRSSRLFSNANSVKENTTKPTTARSKPGQTKISKGKTRSRTSKSSTISQPHNSDSIIKPDQNEKHKSNVKAENVVNRQSQILSFQKASAEGLLTLLRDIGKAYVLLSQFECLKAINKLISLPPCQFSTAWIQCKLAKAYFELANYHAAEKAFSTARKLDPYHIEGMEVYSTVLWHLQKEMALSALSQELTQFDKNSPEVWCAAGNCFSLQKEHDTAIKFFTRAIQVDESFAYAYTLLGHEYVATEELNKAMNCFRNASRINSRHYNAWYGIGMIYYKQEKFALAEMHYRKALEINPRSSVLLTHISVVQQALHKPDLALQTLNRAISLDKDNPSSRFQKASILFATDKHQEALKELEDLKQLTPNESSIYFLMGKVHRKLGNMHLALANFSWTLDLDPKGADSLVKDDMEKHYMPDDDDLSALADLEDDEAVEGEDTDMLLDGDTSVAEGSQEGDDMQLQANESDGSL